MIPVLLTAFFIIGLGFVCARPDLMRPLFAQSGLLPRASALVELSMERMPSLSGRAAEFSFLIHNAGSEDRSVHYVVSAIDGRKADVLLDDGRAALAPDGVEHIGERADLSRLRLPATIYVRLPDLDEYIRVTIPHAS